MPENDQFEYAVVRVVPQVEREEFLNVGVVLFCAKQKFLQMKYHLNTVRLQAFCPQVDLEEISEYLTSFEQICAGAADAGPIARLSMAERFRWLTSTRSTMVQTSKVHPGLCTDAGEMLTKIYTQQAM
ncbi:MAG TPA: DUF3037 domain-containing protein [Ferruginibacter sp.]|nr:DUF3037 domain-containing protein [Ferruginibacter sp.]